MNVTVFIGASLGGDQMYEFEAKALGKWIGENGHKLVYGGSKIGLMGVLADSVLEHGGEVIGVETAFFLEQKMQHDNLTELSAQGHAEKDGRGRLPQRKRSEKSRILQECGISRLASGAQREKRPCTGQTVIQHSGLVIQDSLASLTR